jgi:nucleoside 2-deoxyribosyltransferase
MKVYLAGPMRTKPNFNREAFERYTDLLRKSGYEVFSPSEYSLKLFGDAVRDNADGDESKMGGDAETIGRTVFGIDMAWICSQADAIALMPGWEMSKGASAERAVGLALGLVVRNVEEFIF